MSASPSPNTHGIALLEAVTALFVVAIGLFGSFQMFQYCIDEIRAINEYGTAARVVRNELETLRAQPFDAIELGPGRPFVSSSPELETLAAARTFTDTKADPAMPTRLKQVTAVVRWRTEHGRFAERRLTTLVARRDRP